VSLVSTNRTIRPFKGKPACNSRGASSEAPKLAPRDGLMSYDTDLPSILFTHLAADAHVSTDRKIRVPATEISGGEPDAPSSSSGSLLAEWKGSTPPHLKVVSAAPQSYAKTYF